MTYTNDKTGYTVEVFTPYANGEDYTGIEVTNRKGEWVAEMGCWFDGKRLVDYDGCFGLLPDIATALRKAGWVVPHDMVD